MNNDILDKNSKLLELYQREVKENPNHDSQLTSLMLLDMTVKNGGLQSYLDYEHRGFENVVKYASENKLSDLIKICDYIGKIIKKYKGDYDDLTESEVEKLDSLSERYYNDDAFITNDLFTKHISG